MKIRITLDKILQLSTNTEAPEWVLLMDAKGTYQEIHWLQKKISEMVDNNKPDSQEKIEMPG